MIRLLLALIIIGALGHFVRWVFTGRLRKLGTNASARAPQSATSAPVSTTRRLLTSAAQSVLVGGAVVLVLFIGKLIYFEFARSALTRSSAVETPRARASITPSVEGFRLVRLNRA